MSKKNQSTGFVIDSVYHESTESPYDEMDESDNPYSDDEVY